MAVVYKITNPKGRIYIGSTINFEKRIRGYKNGKSVGQVKLYNSIQKYGFENHKIEILCECPSEERYKWENHYGMMHNVLSLENLNLRLPKGNDMVSCISEETRRKLSESAKGKVKSNETRRKISEWNKGKVKSNETRRKIGEKSKKKKYNEEYRKKLSIASSGKNNPMYGKHHSAASKKKISDFMSGEKNPWLGKHHTEESKLKMSVSAMSDKNPQAKKVINTFTRIIYGCIKEAAEQSNYSYGSFKNIITGKCSNKTTFMLLTEWEKLN